MNRILVVVAASLLASIASTAALADDVAPTPATARAASPASAPSKEVPPVLRTSMTALDGSTLDFSKYAGKVLLVVNTASKCGYTPQYEGLEAIHRTYAPKGLAVVGVPSNDFGEQEPGTSEEIAAFCKKNYGVTFDMTSKVKVTGDDKTPLYGWLTSAQAGATGPGEVKWNFEKFLVARDGSVAGRWGSKTKPDDPAFVAAIEAELAKPAP